MIVPRWYQEEAIDSIYHYYKNGGKGNPVIALPTAAGKSIVPAVFIERVLKVWNTQRFMVITHVHTLITQNKDKMLEVWANAPLGVHSAGLKRRDFMQPIIYGGIQSIIKVAEFFGHRDIIFVDECHLVNQEENSQYLKFFAIMKKINPNLKIVGFTATKYRMGQGLLTQDGIFTDIIYDMTDMEGFNRLLAEGYLCPLVPQSRVTKLDITNVGIQQGEFVQKQLQHEVDKADITWKGLQEDVYYGQNRKSWLIFASGIDHSNHIAEMLNKLGVECASVHSKQSSDYNDRALKAHKNLELRAIVSFSKLTTGLDHPAVDLIADWRPTMSTVLHVQKGGRGMRPYLDKINCLYLDHAGNISRLGPFNDPVLPRKKGDKTGTLPIKICEACGVYNHIKAVRCDACANPFEFKIKINETASIDQPIRGIETLQIDTFDITYCTYVPKQKDGKSPFIIATYYCKGMVKFPEFIFPENMKFRKPFHDWWMMRHTSEPPTKTHEAMKFISELRTPKRIRVHTNRMVDGRNLPEVLSCEF